MAEALDLLVGVRFAGDDLIAETLTALLGREPTKSWRKGQGYPSRSDPDGFRIRKWGLWSLDSLLPRTTELEEQIEALLSPLTGDLKVWRDLSDRYEGRVSVGHFMLEYNEGYELTPRVLKLLADRHLTIWFDIYSAAHPDDEEDTP